MFRVNPLLLALAVVLVSASSGDRSEEFEECVSYCLSNTSNDCNLSLALRLTRWTCLDDCRYQCMHVITDKAVVLGSSIHQYFGKWPFIRLGGIQEPASVAFSVLNGLAHIRGAILVRNKVPDGHPMKPFYMVWSFVSVNAWIWSSVFHTRDLSITEKLDYFSAALAILFALYFTVIRFFHIYPPFPRQLASHVHTPPSRTSLFKLWSFICLVAYFAHVAYLAIPTRFDYSYNIAFNLVLGLSHNALWAAYSFPSAHSPLRRFPFQPKTYRPAYATKAAAFVVLTTAATALEVFDFPPWGRIIDAHALWHLATVPISRYWYNFLVEDALDDGWRRTQKG